MIFSCTKKVIDRFKKDRDFDAKGEPIGIYNWYANEITLSRKKYILFVNSLTLFSFLVKTGTSKERNQIEQLFEKKISKMLIREISTSKDIFNKMLPKPLEYRFTKTSDKSVLGSMNDIVQQVKYHHHFDHEMNDMLDGITHRINTCPFKALGFDNPINRLKKELGVLRIVK